MIFSVAQNLEKEKFNKTNWFTKFDYFQFLFLQSERCWKKQSAWFMTF